MKVTDRFKETLKDYLDLRASNDVLFASMYEKENKNLDDCVKYILNTVQKSGFNGFADDEIFSMAVHYYDEDKIEIGGDVNCKVVVNHHVELTEEEKTEAKEKAIKKAEDEQYKKITKKTHVVKPVSKEAIQTSLF